MPQESTPPAMTFLEMISKAPPGASAIEDVNGGKMTYGQLKANAHKVVGFLNNAGFKKTDRIAIIMPNGPQLAVTIVSVASGFTAMPINPDYKAPEFENYLLALHPKALLTKAGTMSWQMEIARNLGLETLELIPSGGNEAGAFSLGGPDKSDLVEPEFTRPDDTVFVFLTSGTTSLPKRIPLTNANICWSLHYLNRDGALDSRSRFLIFFPFFHAGGTLTFCRSISNGGTAICTAGSQPTQFYRWLDETKPTAYTAAPAIHQMILEMAKDHRDAIACSSLRWIMTGSASMPSSVVQRMEETLNVPVIEAYGSTEVYGIGTSPLPPKKRKYAAVIPCVPELAVMDEQGRPQPVGTLGEIAVRGPNVFGGYEEDSEANAKTFFNGWYKTGDLGQMDEEGYLHLCGRVKDLINKGGEKISPFEVDEALMGHPAVLEAITFPVPHTTLGEDLDAAVVLRLDQKVSEYELRKFLFERLADFKVPTRILFVMEIPKGSTGKASRQEIARVLGFGR